MKTAIGIDLPPVKPLSSGKITEQDILLYYVNAFKVCQREITEQLSAHQNGSQSYAGPCLRCCILVDKLERVNELRRLCDNRTIKPVTQPTKCLSNTQGARSEYAMQRMSMCMCDKRMSGLLQFPPSA